MVVRRDHENRKMKAVKANRFRQVTEMADTAWNVEQFGSGLTAVLVAALTDVRGFDPLSRVVTECAAAAEAVCCERPIACTAGCPHCCVLNVSILLPEGMIIAEWLQERLSPSELGVLLKRLADHCRRVRWMEDDERITKQVS
jgi:hypothetical protein